MESGGNPFLALLGESSISSKGGDLTEDKDDLTARLQEKDELAERIFLLTIQTEDYEESRSQYVPNACVYVGIETITRLSDGLKECYEMRLSYEEASCFVVDRKENTLSSENDQALAGEENKLTYVYMCFQRLCIEDKNLDPNSHLKMAINSYRDVLFEGYKNYLIGNQSAFTELFKKVELEAEVENNSTFKVFFHKVIGTLSQDPSGSAEVTKNFKEYLDVLYKKIVNTEFIDILLLKYIRLLSIWAGSPLTAQIIIDYKTNVASAAFAGILQTNTLMEELLKKTGLITDPNTQEFMFFSTIRGRNSDDEVALHNSQIYYHEALTMLYKAMCKNQKSREALLQWVGNYMEKNSYLGKMWPHQQINPIRQVLKSDAIFLNLASVFLRLSQDFCSSENAPQNKRLLRINPLYCAATGLSVEEKARLNVHINGLHQETCIVKSEEPIVFGVGAEKMNFLTEMFFYTHRCLYLGCHGLMAKFYNASRPLNQMERIYAEASLGGNDSTSAIITEFERGLKVYMSTKAALSDPELITNCCNFIVTTAQFLCQVSENGDMKSFAKCKVAIGDEAEIPRSITAIPEFIIENMVDYIVFINRFAKPKLSVLNFAKNDLMLMLAIFMGSKKRINNPHLRCTLTDILDAIFFFEGKYSDSTPDDWLGSSEFAPQLSSAVMQLSVDMEISRDDQLSYEKFGFRKTLYKVLKIMWKSDKCKDTILTHAKFAYEHIEATTHPLFLGFINLILNDITYLLDEAMSHLIAIKDAEMEKSRGEWESLNDQDKKQKEDKLQQDINTARYYNTLSNLTLDTLVYLSSDKVIKNLLCHPVLVERVALMINDFLLKLVGPKMGALRVQNFNQCSFEPRQLVTDICTIYTNMANRDEFCQAVVRDGRSYDDKLFSRALRVLSKLNQAGLQYKFNTFAQKCTSMGAQEEEEEKMFENAPDEFYDQLTYTIMIDPVTLPTSKKVVDRATISRHLLDDTTDPFNRQPLTMDQVIPNTEIKQQIEKWKQDWKNK